MFWVNPRKGVDLKCIVAINNLCWFMSSSAIVHNLIKSADKEYLQLKPEEGLRHPTCVVDGYLALRLAPRQHFGLLGP